ncbi:B-cell receptor CD22-like isoform X2 [Xiphias gladius]|nr:B-cell receptor CD22-like isoform X2 [Xiphias gladius]
MRGAAVSLTAAASGFVVLLLTVPVVRGYNGWGVTYTSTKICALKGSTVEMNCTYRFPSRINSVSTKVEETFWFTKASNNIYADLRTDPDYSDRVEYRCKNNDCTLRITDLRESDSAEYKFRFITNQPGGSFTGSPGVTLSVTGLQVQLSSPGVRTYDRSAELMCRSNCRLPDHTSYIWYKNQKEILRRKLNSLNNFELRNHYSCAVQGHEDFPSSSLLVQGQVNWGVTYAPAQICAFRGSTVEMNCTYRFPSRINSVSTKVEETFWFTKLQDKEPVDLRTDSEYAGRLAYSRGKNNDCTLRITDLRASDSAEYKFRFKTNLPGGSFTGSPGVTLSVTDPQLQVRVRRSTVNPYSTWTELTCHSNCQPSHHLSYTWYKNENSVEGGEEKYFHLHTSGPGDKYHCAIGGDVPVRSPPVYAPEFPAVSVSPSGEIVEGSPVTLNCSSNASPAANYTWYKEDANPGLPSLQKSLSFGSIKSSDSGRYYCRAENELGWMSAPTVIVVKYAPKLLSMSATPSGEIVEGSSVNLTCSSDANPAANYTWYKGNQTLLQGPEGFYHFTSISSEDRGFYRCKAENQFGQINSSSLLVDVQYAPKLVSVSASPSGEIMEGSSVNLTCSSDANPAANYTWYKGNQTLLQGPEGFYHFTSISSEDRGFYRCKAENQFGQINSSSLLVDVEYAPRLVSVSASPSGDIVEGSSVNLTCSSDANPAANYTWYKGGGDSPQASGQTFAITGIRAELGGNYYCEARNRRGRRNNTLHLNVVADFPEAWKSAVIGTITVVVLAIILLSAFLLIKEKITSKQSSEPVQRIVYSEKCLHSQSEEQDDPDYTNIHFLKNQTDPVCSNIGLAGPCRRDEEEDDDSVEYTVVKFNSSAPRARSQEIQEDPATLYSTIKTSF